MGAKKGTRWVMFRGGPLDGAHIWEEDLPEGVTVGDNLEVLIAPREESTSSQEISVWVWRHGEAFCVTYTLLEDCLRQYGKVVGL